MNINSKTVWELKRLIFLTYMAICWDKETINHKHAPLEIACSIFL